MPDEVEVEGELVEGGGRALPRREDEPRAEEPRRLDDEAAPRTARGGWVQRVSLVTKVYEQHAVESSTRAPQDPQRESEREQRTSPSPPPRRRRPHRLLLPPPAVLGRLLRPDALLLGALRRFGLGERLALERGGVRFLARDDKSVVLRAKKTVSAIGVQSGRRRGGKR